MSLGKYRVWQLDEGKKHDVLANNEAQAAEIWASCIWPRIGYPETIDLMVEGEDDLEHHFEVNITQQPTFVAVRSEND